MGICSSLGWAWRPLAAAFLRWIAVAVLLLPPARADQIGTISSFRIENGIVIVEFASSPGEYFLLEESGDLLSWHPADMSLGPPSELADNPLARHRYFRARPFSKFAPWDTDGDGMDDLYEMNTPNLNPLDPSDGSRLTPDGSGRTNYQNYLRLFGITSYKILQREGREVSVFNFGSPSATFEANSREQSIFNFGSPSATIETMSRELSLYNGQAVPYSDLLQIEGREVSVFNFGQPAPGPSGATALAEALRGSVCEFHQGRRSSAPQWKRILAL